MMMDSTRPIFVLYIAVCLLTACGHLKQEDVPASGTGPPVYNGLVAFYHGPLNHLSAVRRGNCPMHPSCSQYSRQAFAAHGPIIGWMMTIDRLLRCGRNELDVAPRVFIDGQVKFYDPLWSNDGWWHTPEGHLGRAPSMPEP
jgi:putative component of membrane protein insertase Oxa1/YidC/SpoIIIJ protein YidD